MANTAYIEETAAPKPRDEIANGTEHSFGRLAQAVVVKAETIDANVATLEALTKVLAEMTVTCKTLTATNSTLVTALTKCEGKTKSKPPPGFSQTGSTTGHAHNTASNACPTHLFTNLKTGTKSRVPLFVTQQHCTTCGKEQYHLPAKYHEEPHNKAVRVAR